MMYQPVIGDTHRLKWFHCLTNKMTEGDGDNNSVTVMELR